MMPERNMMPKENMMNDAEIDPILSGQDELLPSAGFVASVMDAVRREAAAPPPIPFPWKRALPGLALAVAALALLGFVGVFAVTQHGGASTTPQLVRTLPWNLAQGLQEKIQTAAVWTTLALLVTLVTVKFSMRLAAGRP
jgi:hypothetical protein